MSMFTCTFYPNNSNLHLDDQNRVVFQIEFQSDKRLSQHNLKISQVKIDNQDGTFTYKDVHSVHAFAIKRISSKRYLCSFHIPVDQLPMFTWMNDPQEPSQQFLGCVDVYRFQYKDGDKRLYSDLNIFKIFVIIDHIFYESSHWANVANVYSYNYPFQIRPIEYS